LNQDDAPPALLYLAVRSARRALDREPQDARAWLALGEGYLWLLRRTRERSWSRRVPELDRLRRAQASTALNRAIALEPALPRAHALLAGMYQEMGYLDLALEHLRASRKRWPGAGGPDGADAGWRPDEDLVDQLARAVAEGEKAYAARVAGLSVLD